LTSCFCISPPSRPLTSTPFPYTPLFRSAAPPSPRQAIAPTIGAVHRRAAVARKHSEPASAPVDNAQAAAIKKGTEQQRSAATQTVKNLDAAKDESKQLPRDDFKSKLKEAIR